MSGEGGKYTVPSARKRSVLDLIRARAGAHATTRDREPAPRDQPRMLNDGSQRHDIKALWETVDLLAEILAEQLEDQGRFQGVPGATGKQGPVGPQGPEGPPGECDCVEFLLMGA